MKYGCICGWIGTAEQRVKFGEALCCPVCVRKCTPRVAIPLIQCHWCGTSKHVQPLGNRQYHCHQCRRTFDDDVDEGAVVATSDDPVRSAMRAEEQENRSQRPKKRSRPRHYF